LSINYREYLRETSTLIPYLIASDLSLHFLGGLFLEYLTCGRNILSRSAPQRAA